MWVNDKSVIKCECHDKSVIKWECHYDVSVLIGMSLSECNYNVSVMIGVSLRVSLLCECRDRIVIN